MKILILEDDLVDYGIHLLTARLASGFVNLEEMQSTTAFHTALLKAAPIDFSKLGNVDLQGLKPGPNGGVTLGLTADQEETNNVRAEAGGRLPGPPCALTIGADDVCGLPENATVHHRGDNYGHAFVVPPVPGS